MRIAHLMAGAPVGGAELFYERLLAAQRRAGCEVLPLIRRDAGRAARLAAAGLAPVQLRYGSATDLLTGPRLRGALRRFGPAVAMAWMGRAARFAPRGPWSLVGRLGGYYDLGQFRRCDHLVANTAGLVRWIAGQGWPADRVHHLPNFAPDLAGSLPDRAGVPAGARLVLAMGRLHRNKGFDVLIRALRRLPAAHLLLAGEGPERAALEALAAGEGVAARVHMPGWRADTGALLAACDVLACPSRQEPLGNVVVEAFAAGRPVVAAAAAGPGELLRPGEDGLLVPVDDAEALATSLGLLLGNPVLAQRLAHAGRARFLAEFAEAPVLAHWATTLAALAPA